MRLPNLRPNTFSVLVTIVRVKGCRVAGCADLIRAYLSLACLVVYPSKRERVARSPRSASFWWEIGALSNISRCRSPEWKKCWDLLRGTFCAEIVLGVRGGR